MNCRVRWLLACSAVFLIILTSVHYTTGQTACTIAVDKQVYAYSPQRRPNDVNGTCVARSSVNVTLPFSKSVCTRRSQDMTVRWWLNGVEESLIFTVQNGLMSVTERSVYGNALSGNADIFYLCITKLGIEEMLVLNTKSVQFEFEYIARACSQQVLCVGELTKAELRVDNESIVANAGTWFEANGSRENVATIRCHDDRVATPFVNGSFVLQADAVDNDLVASRADSDAFEYSAIQFWNESAEVTFRLLNMTGVDEASVPTVNGSDLQLVSILVQSVSIRKNARKSRIRAL
jgi:hypothetical protein